MWRNQSWIPNKSSTSQVTSSISSCRGSIAPDRRQNHQQKILALLSRPACPAIHVPDRSANSHRKSSSPRSTTSETHTVASPKQLEVTGITRKGHSHPQVLVPPSKVVARTKQCASRSIITPTKTCSADLYRCIKRRMGRSLK